MDEKEKKLREDLEFHLDTLRRNLEVCLLYTSSLFFCFQAKI